MAQPRLKHFGWGREGEGLTAEEEAATLDRYIADPEGVVPGSAMSAPPLRDEKERADLIAYLALSGPYEP